MRLHNTLSKNIEEFAPLDADKTRIYSCGPTVYDHIHIGNLSSFIYADTLNRVLKSIGQNVTHVMNFTDVDDKTINRSQQRFPDIDPKEALEKLTTEYSEIFLKDMRAIGNQVESYDFIKATDSIDSMKELINRLHEAGFAYIADDGVYFSIAKYRESGKIYGQLLNIDDSNTSAARIHNDEYDKESVHDFALWKKQKGNEPAWEFSLEGQDITGRPGWHIECSAMSKARLGQPFDIHTGGIDLIFPHHENEIAQSTATEENPLLAKYFFHNEHLLIDGKKMSKSLNNFFTLEDIIKKGFDPLAFRLMVLQSHYRSQANFTWENLEAAQNRLEHYHAFADLRWQIIPGSHTYSDTTDESAIKSAMQDDVNTPRALAAFSGYTTVVNDNLVFESNKDQYLDILGQADALFGLQLLKSKDISDEQKQSIYSRQKARDDKDWTKSDEIRGQLEKQGLGLRDTPQGQIWFRL